MVRRDWNRDRGGHDAVDVDEPGPGAATQGGGIRLVRIHGSGWRHLAKLRAHQRRTWGRGIRYKELSVD